MTILEQVILDYDKKAVSVKESEDSYEVKVVDVDGNEYSYEVLENGSSQYYEQRDSMVQDILNILADSLTNTPYEGVRNILPYYLDEIPSEDLGYELFKYNYWIRKL